MTAGIIVPVDTVLLSDAITSVPALLHKAPHDAIDDRRLAETVCRAAIEDGIMHGVTYKEPDEA